MRLSKKITAECVQFKKVSSINWGIIYEPAAIAAYCSFFWTSQLYRF